VTIKEKPNGFSLVEVCVALALVGLLATGISIFAIQTITETNRSNAHMQVIQQLENVGFWLSRDVQTAQTVTTGPNSGFPLQLDWTDKDTNVYQVTFSISGN
jgi:prepilin-type N-terminal cleavage/methylation domain-containing protein